MAPKAKSKAVVKKCRDQKQPDVKSLPKWPSLTPRLPAFDCSLDSVLDGQIYLIRNLFAPKLCRDYVSFLSTLPLTTTPGKPQRGHAVRVNDRYQVDDFTFAQTLWQQTAVQELVSSCADARRWGGEVLGLNANIRIYRYRPGQFFGQHYDESNKVDFGEEKIQATTTWTLLIYLTTCEGGETVFYPEREGKTKNPKSPPPISISPDAGVAVLHKHGDDCMLHEGREVISGEKWVLRSDLVVKR